VTLEFLRHGECFLLDACGTVFWPARSLLIVADLHLEKGSSLARRGVLVPPYDTRTTLLRLRGIVARLDPAVVVCLGDSFHDQGGSGRLLADDRDCLVAIAGSRDWIWIAGNHDPAPPQGLPGRSVPELALGPIRMRHEALPADGGPMEISGHFHPRASVATRARRVTRPCFVGGRSRLFLPAFGAYTGGLDILDPVFARLCPDGFDAFVLGQERLFRFAVAGRSLDAGDPQGSPSPG